MNQQDLDKFNAFLLDRRTFSYKTFGSKEVRGCVYPLRHLKKEVQELLDNIDDPMEWADCFLLFTDAAERKGHSFNDLIDFAMKKLEINKKRTWAEGPNGVIEHTNDE